MNKADSAAGPRRVVTKVVLTYIVEGDAGQKEHTVTLSRDPSGASHGNADTIDGVVWSRKLMDRLGYIDGHDAGKPVPKRPARPEDGWKRQGRVPKSATTEAAATASPTTAAARSTTAAATDGGGNGECLWLHSQSCVWVSLCDDT